MFWSCATSDLPTGYEGTIGKEPNPYGSTVSEGSRMLHNSVEAQGLKKTSQDVEDLRGMIKKWRQAQLSEDYIVLPAPPGRNEQV